MSNVLAFLLLNKRLDLFCVLVAPCVWHSCVDSQVTALNKELFNGHNADMLPHTGALILNKLRHKVVRIVPDT